MEDENSRKPGDSEKIKKDRGYSQNNLETDPPQNLNCFCMASQSAVSSPRAQNVFNEPNRRPTVKALIESEPT
jgi:hypothetical protein